VRIRSSLGISMIVAAWALSGCGSGEVPESRFSGQAIPPGCNLVCPTCPAGQDCSDQCTLDCPIGIPCGASFCHQDSYCCNPTCGICVTRGYPCPENLPCNIHQGGGVETALCIRGYHWSTTFCECVPDGTCRRDSDCNLVADYCTGCDCRAQAQGDAPLTCDGPGVQCFADACLNLQARCVHDVCTAVTARGPHVPVVRPQPTERPRPPRPTRAPRPLRTPHAAHPLH